LATAPNQCDDDTCTATTGNEGSCAAGPIDFFCAPVDTFTPCFTDLDCSAFPGDTCTRSSARSCYTDNGTVGASVNSTGVADPPFNHSSDPTLASLFCISPTASASVNAAAGLPGLGRLELRGHAHDDGTSSACPSTITFEGNSGGRGVLDAGWTGNGHNASIVSGGRVTVAVTGCAGAAPNCGSCTYAGPIDNVDAAPVP
jgi:hypothetical protein